MKKINRMPFNISIILFGMIAFAGMLTHAQSYQPNGDTATRSYWFDMMQDPNAKFDDVVRAANIYFSHRNIEQKGIGYKVFKRWEYINQYRVLADGKRQSPGYVFDEYHQYLIDAANSASGNWALQGPATYVGNNTGQPTGMGRINAIAFHPTDGNTIFVGSPSGGFWKTVNGGTTWSNLSSNLPTIGVSSIMVHPTNANIIYIGSGDRDSDDAIPLGVFKTTDGGATWTQINGTMGNVIVGAMLMHPSDPNTIIAATSAGIFKTTNGGSTWSQKASGNFKDLQFKPGDPTVIYAVKIVTPSEFHRSTNTGDSWTQITAGIPTSGIGSRMVMGVSAANGSYVYLLQIKSSDGTLANILRSTDSGLNFSSVATGPNLLGYACIGDDNSSQATYDLCMTVDPLNVNNVLVGGINNWKSSDAGVTWTISSHWIGSGFGEPCASTVHADQHCFAWSPVNGRLYVGHDGGISYTANGGTTWTEITNNLAITQIYKIGQGAGNVNYTVFGCQDNGDAATTNGTSFYTTSGGDGMECVIDYDNSNYCFNTYYGGITRRSTTGPTGSYSTIAGNGTNGINESGAWVAPYFLHKSDPNTMFLGMKNVWRSNNIRATPGSSITWTKISSGETENCIDIEQSVVDVNVIYAARSSTLQRTDNANASAGSVTWTICTLPGGTTPTDIAAHPSDVNIVYATAGYKVYKSSDKGMTWTDISANLPALFNNCLVIDKNANEGLYVGNQTSVWYKDATMTNWALFSNGLPPVDIRELEIYYDNGNPSNNRIKCGTYGRGLWQSDLMKVNVIDPSGFTATPMSNTQIDLSWIKNAANDNVIIAWAPINTFGQPVDGTGYSVGNSIPGGGTIMYTGSATGAPHTGLAAGTTYYYKIWSVNSSSQYSAGLPPVSATTYSHAWTAGAGTSDWFTPGNWGAGTVPVPSDNVYIPAGPAFMPQINASGATCTNILIESGASLTMSASTTYTLSVAGDWTNNGTFTRGIGTVEFNGSNSLQTIKGSAATAFHLLTVNKGSLNNILEVTSIITLNAAANPLDIVSGTFKLSSPSTLTPFTTGSGSELYSTDGFWNNGGTINGGNFTMYNAGMLRISAGTMNIGTSSGNSLVYWNSGKIIIEGGALNISGRLQPNSGTSIGTYSQSGGIVTVNTVGSTSTSRAPFELNPGVPLTWTDGNIVVRRASSNTNADVIISSNSAVVTGGTMQIGDASTPASQNIRINSTVPIYNLTVNANNSPTAQLLTNGLTIRNDVTISGGVLNANNLNLTVGGNWINHGTFTAGNGLVTLNGAVSQNLGGTNATTFNNLTVNNVAGITLNGSINATVNGILNLTSGVITTGNNKVIIPSTGYVSRTAGHVCGNLQKYIATGSGISSTFEIGDASVSGFTPVSITFSSVGSAGNLTAKTTAGDHPDIGTSVLNATKSVNRYWSLTDGGVGFTTYDAVFNFLNSDLDGPASTADLVCGKYTSPAWSYPPVGTRTATSTGITGVTSFSDFQLAESLKTSISAGGNWSNPATWSPAGVPVSTDDVTITSPGTVVVDINNAVCNNLTIQSGATLAIDPGKSLTVSGTLTNNGGTAGLVVKSTAAGTGSLIHPTGDVDATFERYMSDADWTNPADGWHFVSSPVLNQPISPAFTTNPYDFYCWYEPSNLWVNYKNTTTAPTWATANGSNDFVLGRGYLAEYDEAGVKLFTGKFNVADITVSGLAITPSGTNRSWHLLGNPFGSALEWDASASWSLSNIAGVAKIWNEENQSYSDITSSPAGYIPATNGFMAQVVSGTGSLVLPAVKRVHSSQPFYKSHKDVMQLKVTDLTAGGTQESQIILYDQASESFDLMYDGEFLAGYAPQFYSLAGGMKLSTNALPQVTEETRIPLGFVRSTGTAYRLDVSDIPLWAGKPILQDLKTGTLIDLGVQHSYSFTAADGDNEQRFLLKFTNVGIDDPQPVRLSAWYSNHTLCLSNMTGDAQVELYDMAGRQVKGYRTVLNRIPVNLTGGIYLARITTDKESITIKFLVK